MKTSGSLVIVFLLWAGVSAGDDKNGSYAIRGAGLIDCQTYLVEKERQSQAYIMMGGWIDGYLTGINQLSDDTYDITPYQSTEIIAKIVETHCQNNSEHRLFTVVSSIAAQLHDDRISMSSELITINVDDKSARLYRETIRRMQSRLVSIGFYDDVVAGEFNAATLEAIKAYQKSIGYEATGFPDQATLWKLFAEKS